MAKSAYIGAAIRSLPVSDGDFDHFKVLFHGAEDQIKVAERIEFPEITPVGPDLFVIPSKEGFCAAKGILESLIQSPRKHGGEKLVAQEIQKSHSLLFHGVHEPATVDKFTQVL